MQELGTSDDLSNCQWQILEEYVAKLFGSSNKTTNEARYSLFKKKYTDDKKVIDLSVLPPCQSILQLHIKRANYVAYIWKSCCGENTEMPPAFKHGWNEKGEIQWIEDPFPADVCDILITDDDEEELESDNEEEIGSDNESDESDIEF